MSELRNTNADLEIGIGNTPGRSTRTVSGNIIATTTESVVSLGLTGRYPFPSTAAQMNIVSGSANDTAAGTGAQIILVRGLTVDGGDWIDDSEVIALNGTTPVTTAKSYIRVNSLVVAAVGAGGANEGTITMTNGINTLHSMEANSNITRAAIWSTATLLPTYARSLIFIGGKSVNDATFRAYLTPTVPISVPTLKAFEITAFEGESIIDLHVPFELGGGTDFEVTATASAAAVSAATIFEMTQVELS